MKKIALLLCTFAGLYASPGVARADRGDEYRDAEDGPRYSHRHSREYDRSDRDDCDRRPSRNVYVIEDGCAVRRVVYFDDRGGCFYPAGGRRVYVDRYYSSYPRFGDRGQSHFHRHGRRPHFRASFGF